MILAAVIGGPKIVFGDTAKTDLLNLNDQITAKKNQIDTLKQSIQSYQDKIDGLENQ